MSLFSSVFLATLVLAPQPLSQDREPFVQELEKHLAKFKMVPVPGGIYMSETEVTWDLYDVWAFRQDLSPEEHSKGVDAKARPSKPYGAPDRGFGHKGYPAIGMTFKAANDFCAWLSKATGRKYRLPTEDEWKLVATHTAPSEANSWHWENADDTTHPVGKKAPNEHGLHDLLGNAAEWCQGRDGKGVLRGGSFMTKLDKLTPLLRETQTADWNARDPQNPKSKWWLSDAPFAGFRLVCEP